MGAAASTSRVLVTGTVEERTRALMPAYWAHGLEVKHSHIYEIIFIIFKFFSVIIIITASFNIIIDVAILKTRYGATYLQNYIYFFLVSLFLLQILVFLIASCLSIP